MKILNANKKSFERQLDQLLSIRKSKVKLSSASVKNIIKDVKKKWGQSFIEIWKKI